MEHLLVRNSDVAFITETWLKLDKNSITAQIKSYGYLLIHNTRNDPEKEGGGGVGILIKSVLCPSQVVSKSFISFEYTVVKLSCANNKPTIDLYRSIDYYI